MIVQKYLALCRHSPHCTMLRSFKSECACSTLAVFALNACTTLYTGEFAPLYALSTVNLQALHRLFSQCYALSTVNACTPLRSTPAIFPSLSQSVTCRSIIYSLSVITLRATLGNSILGIAVFMIILRHKTGSTLNNSLQCAYSLNRKYQLKYSAHAH
jgi:hypothetical protein